MPTERFKTRAVRLSSFHTTQSLSSSSPSVGTVKMAEVKKSKTPREFASEHPFVPLQAPPVAQRVAPGLGGSVQTPTDPSCPPSRFHDGRCLGREYTSRAPLRTSLTSLRCVLRPSPRPPPPPSSVSSSWCRTRMRWCVGSRSDSACLRYSLSCLSRVDQAGPSR